MPCQQIKASDRWDRAAIGLSALCAVHCVATIIFVLVLSSVGSFLLNPLFHEIGIGLAIVIGLVALGRGIMDHGRILPAVIGVLGLSMMTFALTLGHGLAEAVSTILGVTVLAVGHGMNSRAAC